MPTRFKRDKFVLIIIQKIKYFSRIHYFIQTNAETWYEKS